MELGLPSSLNEKANSLTLMIQQNIQENEEWYRDTLQNLKKGEVFPYDERLGVTEEEYSFFLKLDEYMELVKQADSVIEIRSEGEDLVINRSGSNVLGHFKINKNGKTISTEIGELSYSGKVKASNGQKVTGRWNGHSWKLENTKKSVQISIGQLEESDKKILYVRLMEINQETQEEIVFF